MTDPAVLDIHRQVNNVVNKAKKDRASQKKFRVFNDRPGYDGFHAK